MMMLFALSLVTAGLGVYYRDSCTAPYGCLGHSGLLLYVKCSSTLCPVNHTAVDLRQCQDDSGPANGSDTWLDPGCALLGGGCTRRFAKSVGDKPWCVPVALDKNGSFAPAVRVGTTGCRIQCDQDYGTLDANGNVSCACPPSNRSSVDEACASDHAEMDVGTMATCFCQSPSPCNSIGCPCIPHEGAMARTMDLRNGHLDVRAVHPFGGLFPVVPCKTKQNGNHTLCPAGWQQKTFGGYGALALAEGYRFLRPKSSMFYQPTGLSVTAWRMNSCVCVRGCLSDFPTILCRLLTWSRRLVQCIPSAYLETTLDLRHKMLPVEREDRKTATVTAANGTTWTCSIDGRDRCNIPTPRPLESSPDCACLKPCSPSLCSCGSHGFRVFKHFDLSTMEGGLCTLSGDASRIAWSATACKGGTTPCAADERIMDFEFPEPKLFALGYRYYTGNKWMRAMPIERPLQQGECVCIDRCASGAPFLQCLSANATLSECRTTVDFPRGIGEGILRAKDVPRLTCVESVAVINRCNDVTCDDESCNSK